MICCRRAGRSEDADDDEDETRILRTANKKLPLPPQYSFLDHNHQVRQKIETWQTRVRRHDLANLDETLFDFYAKRIQNVSSVHELNRLIRDCGGPEFLCATEADLTGGQALSFDSEAFPDAVPLGGQPVALSYAYTPGEEQDGVTVKLGFSLAQTISQASVEWAVPGLREGLINELLRALPKSLRRELMPFPPKVEEILREFQPGGDSLPQRPSGLHPPAIWRRPFRRTLGPAMRCRRICVRASKFSATTKNRSAPAEISAQLRQKLEQVKIKPAPDDSAWNRVAQQWEQFDLSAWTFGDLPERITVSENGAGAGLCVARFAGG